MYVSRYQVFDQGILVVSNVRLLSHYPRADRTNLELDLFRGEEAPALYRPEAGHLTVSRPGASDHTLQILLAYLAGLRSSAYDAVHAAGLVVEGKGLLCVGGHGSGKTTLLQQFPDATILDDDVVVTNGTTMYGTGGRRGGQHRVDAVVLLRPDRTGGHVEKVDPFIPRSEAVFDSLPPPLQDHYRRLPDVHVDAPVHAIGTHGALEGTVDAIRRVLA